MTERTRQSLKFGTAAEAKTAASAVKAKTESQTLAAANLARVSLYITNNGAKTVWLALGPTAVAETGIMLSAEGGSTTINDYLGIVTVITKESESVVSFSEV